MTLLWAAAEVDLQLSPAARWSGTFLGAVVLSVGLWMTVRGTRSATSAGLHLPWRKPVGGLMALCGLFLAVGVWIDPKSHPQLFIALWSGVLLAVVGFILLAFLDIFSVRWQSLLVRMQLLEENRRETQDELRRRARGGQNGRQHSNGKH